MRRFSFATLVTTLEGRPVATHLPFLVYPEDGELGTLVAHMARANPQWRAFADGNEVLAIDWKTSAKVWTYPGGKDRYESSAAVNDKYVIAGSWDKKVHCINRKTGDGVWTFPTKAHVDSSPVIVGERVFVGSNDGNLYGIDLESGKEVFRFRDLDGRPFSASPAVGEGCLIIGSEGNVGNVYCFGVK
jgi:outer membrane protein assembly factor BamB